MKLLRALAIWALAVLVPAAASAQALTSLQSLRVSYNSRKATVRPEGELKVQIDAVDRELAEATPARQRPARFGGCWRRAHRCSRAGRGPTPPTTPRRS